MLILCSCGSLQSQLLNEKPSSRYYGVELHTPSFLPDGKSLLFCIQNKKGTTIYKLSIEGNSQPISLKNYSKFDYNPVCSPIGNKIVFESGNGETAADICLMDIDGSNKIAITKSPDHDYNPIFSPDGSKIFFIRAKSFKKYSPIARKGWHDSDIYSINLDGSGLTRITNGNYYAINDLSVDPKGEKLLAYMMGRKFECCTIFEIPIKDPDNIKPIKPIINPKDTKLRLLRPFQRRSFDYDKLYNPKFCPINADILFMPNFDEIHIMSSKTGLSKKIIHLDENEYTGIYDPPSFSFDGEKIVFIEQKTISFRKDSYTIWISNADGSGKRNVF